MSWDALGEVLATLTIIDLGPFTFRPAWHILGALFPADASPPDLLRDGPRELLRPQLHQRGLARAGDVNEGLALPRVEACHGRRAARGGQDQEQGRNDQTPRSHETPASSRGAPAYGKVPPEAMTPLPTDTDLFRLSGFETVFIGTEHFVEKQSGA